MSRTTLRYSVLGLAVGPTPSTGFQFTTGFNGVFTGANSGTNLVQQLQRIQTVTDDLSIERTNVNQLGQLAFISQEIVNQPQVNISTNWYIADFSNERKVGLYVSGDQGALTNILNLTQNERNWFLAVAPEGQDLVGWTGQSQVFQFNNCFFDSYSAEASVGGFATATCTARALNYSTSLGSFNQSLNAVNVLNGQIVPGLTYTLPQFTTGSSGIGTPSVVRYGDIVVSVSGAQGLSLTDLHAQSFNINFNTNLQDLQQLGSRFAYAKVPQFPVNLNCSIVANYGDLVTGSLSNLLCQDFPFNIFVSLYQPGCGGYGPLVGQYSLLGMKLASQNFGDQQVGSNVGRVTLNYLGQIGGPGDTRVNLLMTGIN